MTPRDFLDTIVDPNIADQAANKADLRHAFNAIAAVDALAAHMYDWLKRNSTSAVAGIADDTVYRECLAQQSPDFALLRDIAKVQKHVALVRGKPTVTSASQVSSLPSGWGQAAWDESDWGGTPQAAVQPNIGGYHMIAGVLKRSRRFIEGEMTTCGM